MFFQLFVCNYSKRTFFRLLFKKRQYFAHTNDRVANFDGIKITPSALDISIDVTIVLNGDDDDNGCSITNGC